MPSFIDLSGQKYGRWSVKGRAGAEFAWHCVCDCGVERKVSSSSLRAGKSRSCGCLLRESAAESCKKRLTTHGQSHTAIYSVWAAMHDRCRNPNIKNFADYGGRGIKVCVRWSSFENFLADMGPRPAGKSIDRINNDGDYEPGNCRWASRLEQNRNTRRNRYIEFNGKTLGVSEWAEETGFPEPVLWQRIALGWTAERMLTEKPRELARQAIEYRGQSKGVAEWCRELDLPLSTVRSRLFKGWPPQKAFETPIRPKAG